MGWKCIGGVLFCPRGSAFPASAGALLLPILAPGGGPVLEAPLRRICRDSVLRAHGLGLELTTPLPLASTFLGDHLASRPVGAS